MNWSLARARRRIGSGRVFAGSPIVRELREQGYAKAERLLDPEQIAQLLGAFHKKIADRDRVREVRNPQSSHPDFVGKTSISKSPTKFREAMALFDDRLNPHIFEFFQSDFYVFFTEAFRIHALPPGAKAYKGSYYSEDWHLDSFQESDTLKLFVPLHPVTEMDGPTQILDRQRSLEIQHDRAYGEIPHNAAAVHQAVEHTQAWTSMTANPGDVYFALTNHCYHRASVPQAGRTRDMLIFRLRPWHPWSLAASKQIPGRVQRIRTGSRGTR